MSTFEVALQLYTVRETLSHGFLDGLGRVAEVGYRDLEFAGFGDASAAEVARRLQELGMRAIGAHVPLSVLDDIGPIVDDMKTISCSDATLPWVPESMRSDWRETAKRLDETAIKLAEQGIRFAYHNHDFEFIDSGYSQLISFAKWTKFQLDVFWAEKACNNAASLIQEMGSQLSSLHCKDLGEDGNDVEIGRGVLNWPAILMSAEMVGVRTLILEMDTPRMEPIASAKACLSGFQEFLLRLNDRESD